MGGCFNITQWDLAVGSVAFSNGGCERALLFLIYQRMTHKSLHDYGYLYLDPTLKNQLTVY